MPIEHFIGAGDRVSLRDGRENVEVTKLELMPPLTVDSDISFADSITKEKFAELRKGGWGIRVGVAPTAAHARYYPDRHMFYKFDDVQFYRDEPFNKDYAAPIDVKDVDNPCAVCGWAESHEVHDFRHRGLSSWGHAFVERKPDMPGVQKSLHLPI